MHLDEWNISLAQQRLKKLADDVSFIKIAETCDNFNSIKFVFNSIELSKQENKKVKIII